MVSRLTYRGLTGASGEVYGQLNERNYFVKGFAGLGKLLMRGSLQDEDFATASFSPYSSTDSSLHAGEIGYITVDGGGYFTQTANARLGMFVATAICARRERLWLRPDGEQSPGLRLAHLQFDRRHLPGQQLERAAHRRERRDDLRRGLAPQGRGRRASPRHALRQRLSLAAHRHRLLRRHPRRRHWLGLPAPGNARLHLRQPRHRRRRRPLLAHGDQRRHPFRGSHRHRRVHSGSTGRPTISA